MTINVLLLIEQKIKILLKSHFINKTNINLEKDNTQNILKKKIWMMLV